MIKLHIWVYMGTLCLLMWLGTCRETNLVLPGSSKYSILLTRLTQSVAHPIPELEYEDEDGVKVPVYWLGTIRPSPSKSRSNEIKDSSLEAEEAKERPSLGISEYRVQQSYPDCCPPLIADLKASDTQEVLPDEKSELHVRRLKKNLEERYPIHLDPFYHYRFLSRSGECPKTKDGQTEFYCPSPNKEGTWNCIDDYQLCDGVRHCPNGEDELPVPCLFYKVVETHLNTLSKTLTGDKRRRRN